MSRIFQEKGGKIEYDEIIYASRVPLMSSN